MMRGYTTFGMPLFLVLFLFLVASSCFCFETNWKANAVSSGWYYGYIHRYVCIYTSTYTYTLIYVNLYVATPGWELTVGSMTSHVLLMYVCNLPWQRLFRKLPVPNEIPPSNELKMGNVCQCNFLNMIGSMKWKINVYMYKGVHFWGLNDDICGLRILCHKTS